MIQLEKIGINEALKAGDKIQLVIAPRAWLGETIGAYVTASKIASAYADERFRIENWSYNDGGGVTLNIEITDSVQVVQAGVSPWLIALAIVGASIAFVSVTTYKVVSVIADEDNPNAQKLASGVQMFSAAVLIIAVVYFWRSR